MVNTPLSDTARFVRSRPSRTGRSFLENLESRLLLAKLVGIDVSYWDATVNWNVVKNVGLKDFAYIRATYGLNSVDTQLANNVNATSGAQANGLYSGFYHFAYYDLDDTHTANAEADHFFNTVKPYMVPNGKTLQPVLDVERPLRAGWTPTELVQWVNDWCNRVRTRAQSELGLSVTPLIYASRSRAGDSSFYNNTIDQNWPLWVAAWPTPTIPDPQTANPGGSGYWQDWAFWQYAGDPETGQVGTCPGVGDGTSAWPCDLNVLNGDVNTMKDYVIGSEGRWEDGAWVQVNTSSGLNAWNDSSCNSAAPYNDTATNIPNGTLGKILQGPVYQNGYQRWQIQYNNGVTGWSAEPFLATVTPTTPSNPNVSGTVTSLPTNFTWTGGSASSYSVYLDGVLQATVTTPSWAHGAISAGAHTWQVIARNGEFSTAGPSWNFTNSSAPTPSWGGLVPTPGATTFDFTITYTDSDGIDVSSLTNGDITITGPNNFVAGASFVGVDINTNGSPRTATYRINAPGGNWNVTDNGTYAVFQVGNQVRDTTGTYCVSGQFSTFSYSTPFAYQSGSTLCIAFDGASAPIQITGGGSSLNAIRSGTTLAFSGITAVSVLGTAGADNLLVSAPLPGTLAFAGVSGSDTLAVTTATQTFSVDLGAGGATVVLTVDAGASVNLSASQHLRGLTVNGTLLAAPGGGITLVTDALSINSTTGRLDLSDNAIVVRYTSASPLGAWNGSAYTGLTGQIVAGRNGGAWNGPAIITSMTSARGPTMLTTLGIAEASTTLGLSGAQTALWRGEIIDATTVLARYTYSGDATLDGQINGDDYFQIDAGYAASASGYGRGDFNFNGLIDADDYYLIDRDYHQSAAAPLSLSAPATPPPGTLFSAAPIASAYSRLFEASDELSLI